MRAAFEKAAALDNDVIAETFIDGAELTCPIVGEGASAEAIAKLSAEMAEFKVQYANPMFRLPMTFVEIFPVGVLVSLFSAALLRNSRFLPARRGSASANAAA